MVFVQSHNIEDAFGYEYTQRIVISDNPKHLVLTNLELSENEISFVETDMINLTKSNKDLVLYENKFGIDEINFTINEPAAVTDNDKLLIAFLQRAANANDSIYIANYIYNPLEPVNLLNSIEFVGKINEIIKIKELFWNGLNNEYRLEFENGFTPLRQFEFSALSIDAALLSDCKLKTEIRDVNDVLVDNVWERIRANNWNDFIQLNDTYLLFHYTLFEKWDYTDYMSGITTELQLRNTAQATIYDVLQVLLNYATDIITAKLSIPVKFNLIESYLGFDTCPINYNFDGFGDTDFRFTMHKADIKETDYLSSARKPLWLGGIDFAYDNLSTKFVAIMDRDKLHPFFKREARTSPPDIENMQHSQADLLAKKHSLLEKADICEIIYETARAFNCFVNSYITIDDNGVFNINIKFIPNAVLNAADTLTFADSINSTIDVSSVFSDISKQVYCNGTPYTTDGMDEITGDYNLRNVFNQSENYKTEKAEREFLEKQKDVEYKETLFTTASTTIQYFGSLYANNVSRPLNCFQIQASEISDLNNIRTYNPPFFRNIFQADNNILNLDILSNSINVFWLNNGIVYSRPAGYIYAKIDNIDLRFNTLADYVNNSSERKALFYRSERSLTIPSITGFKIGTNYATIQEIRCGQKIQINQKIPIETNGALSYGIETKTFVIVGIERNFESNETTLKLQNDSFFAYAENTTSYTDNQILLYRFSPVNPIEIDNIEYSGTAGNDITRLQPIYYYSNITDFEDISTLTNADAWECIPALAHSDFANYNIGIATIDATNGEVVSFQTAGRISDSSFNFDLNKPVYLRNNGISQNCLLPAGSGTSENQANENENMIIEIGLPDTIFSFVLHQNPIKFVYDTELLNTD